MNSFDDDKELKLRLWLATFVLHIVYAVTNYLRNAEVTYHSIQDLGIIQIPFMTRNHEAYLVRENCKQRMNTVMFLYAFQENKRDVLAT